MKNLFLIRLAISSLFLLSSLFILGQNPTAPAKNFNIFVENNLQLSTNESEGPVACGGNVILAGNYQIAVNNPGTFLVGGVPIGLVVGQKAIYQSGNALQINQNAYVKIGDPAGSTVWYFDQNNAASPIRITPNSNYNSSPRIMLQANSNQLNVGVNNNPVFESNLIDFGAAFQTMRNTSTAMASATHNAQLTNPNGQPIPHTNLPHQVKIELAQGINYLNITGADLNAVQVFTYEQQPSADRILVVNVDASGSFNWNVWNQAGVGFNQGKYVIYNFYNTTDLNIAGNSTVVGTVFAPFADINKTANQSNIQGQVIGKSLVHSGGEMHYAVFQPEIPVGTPTPDPEPTPVAGIAPTTDFSVNNTEQCFEDNEFEFTNKTKILSCPTPFAATEYATPQEAEAMFNDLYFSAEGRSGNNQLNGDFELDIHNVSPYTILSSQQYIWPNNQGVPFNIVYDPTASGNDRFVYTIGEDGVGAGKRVLKLDPEAAGYPMDVNGFLFFARTEANASLSVYDLTIDGHPYNNTLGNINPPASTFTNVVFSGATLEDGFEIEGKVKFAWTGNIPTNSRLNFNFKLGNLDCEMMEINQPNDPISYVWDFGDGSSSTLENPTKSYAAPGEYEVKLTATNTFGSDEITKTVVVFEPLPIELTQSTVSSGNGEVTKQVTLVNANDFTTFSWTSPGLFENAYVDEDEITISFSAVGIYPVTVNVTDNNGCSYSKTISIVVESEDVTTGNDGAIESESLGDAVSIRYVNRKMNSRATVLEKTDDMLFVKENAQEEYQLLSSGAMNMVDMFPANLVEGDIAYVTSPTDILGYTIAKEVLSVDYMLNNRVRAVVLGVKTVDRSYNHTKASCDRLKGAEIHQVEKVKIQGYNFLMQAIEQRNGVLEFAISFAVGKNAHEDFYSLQSNWYVNAYESSEEMFNFQAWSTSPENTIKLVNDIIDNLKADANLVQDEIAHFPKTYVSKIYREGIDLVLNLHSAENGMPVEIFMEEFYSETHGFALRYNPVTSEIKQTVRVEIKDAYEYEGLLKVNGEIQDAFYHADGNWGLDFDPAYTRLEDYRVYNDFERVYSEDEHAIHRNVELIANSNDYLTLYKSLLPGNLPADYSDYNFVSFRAKGSGLIELGLVKSSIQNWNDQYRAMLNVRESWQTYYVPFSFFKSLGNAGNMNPNDLTLLTFTFLPEEAGTSDLNLMIEDVKFTREAPEGYEHNLSTMINEFVVYPNPSNGNITSVLFSEMSSSATVTLRDITGKVVYSDVISIEEGRNEFNFNFEGVTSNMYLLSIENPMVNYGVSKLIIH